MKSKLSFVLTLAAMVVFAAGTGWAADLYVGHGKTYTTIQAAIDDASTGDTIYVAAGTDTETIFQG